MKREEIEQLRRRAAELAKSAAPDAGEILALVDALKAAGEFGTARLLLDQLRPRLAEPPADAVKLAQAHALCTYKDVNLQADRRFLKALAILEEIGLRDPQCRDKETLGQGGAIYKRRWESSGQVAHLHVALAFYRAGWARDAQNDRGWCGVNAAYLLDLLAFRERIDAIRSATPPTQAEAWEAQAKTLRDEMLAQLPAIFANDEKPKDYWAFATLAEIHFGLGQYAAAGEQLAAAARTGPSDWERQTTARQFVNLARLRRVPPPAAGASEAHWHEAWRALSQLLGADTAAVVESWRGKVGLALSGGGFRAALVHLGVLARLAECGVLGSVETLSTVSGGSIVGAQYYLELRRLLQTRTDSTITRGDYVELVRGLIGDTLSGVQDNLRVRVLSNLWSNLKMLFPGSYSRSMRMGELYERCLFDRVGERRAEGVPRRLRDLPVAPAPTANARACGPDFKPRMGNWLRWAKVPNLMLNTTSLNSGHNWHFTARWMGEPPGLTGDEIDMNERYRRLYYPQAPSKALRDYPLAYAVAASSCVPAMFEPLSLKGLYPGRTVRLVDGGVHDNQGMAALLDDDCDFILCSDASGQMESQAKPADGMLGVFWRADGILQDRVRESQYHGVKARADAGALHGLFFVHLKQELDPAPIDWIDCDNPHVEPPASSCTSYGVDREIQRLLSEIRTDLDSFTEVEAYALMASGYQLTAHQLRELDREHQASGLPGSWGGFRIDAAEWHDADGGAYWPFAALMPIMRLAPDSADLRRLDLARQLKAGSIMFGRVWHLVNGLRYSAYALGALAFAAATSGLWLHRGDTVSWSFSADVWTITGVVAATLLGLAFPLTNYLIPQRAGQNVVLGVVVAVFGCIVSNIHLIVFEPLLKRRGKLARLLRLPA